MKSTGDGFFGALLFERNEGVSEGDCAVGWFDTMG